MVKKKSTPLTDTKVKKASPGDYPDAACPGLRLVVGKTMKSWVYRFRSKSEYVTDKQGRKMGRLKQKSIGKYPEMSLADARAKWHALRLARGEGVNIQRQSIDGYTVSQLVADYLDEYAKKLKRSWTEDKRMLEKDLTETWGQRLAKDVTRGQVMELLVTLVPRGERGAALFMAAARKAWNHAADNERVAGNPWARLKIVKGVVMGAGNRVLVEKVEPRHFDDKELKQFLTKMPDVKMRQTIKDVLMLQLLTASRKGEVCEMLWSEVEGGTWTLPASKAKNKQKHLTMLSRQALKIIKHQPRINEFIFGSTRSSCGHIPPTSVNEECNTAQDAFKLPHWTPHALRHSALTGLSMLGASREVQNRVSNHKDSSIAGLYDHNRRDDEARKWLQRWADHLDALTVDNVTVLKGRRA